MKKGLLSILAGALVVVGCQNYDDQFDSLESQINALASTVAGLSQVQSDLSSLAGTVNSLSSTVASLGSAIDTAVSNGLADITADIAALQAAVADVASNEDVAAIADAVAASQEDLDQLLANGSIFQNNITINSVATLDVYHAMGTGINIVNGSVTINSTSDMDATKLQTVVDNILTTTGAFSYTAGTGVDTEVTFNNLSGTMTLTITQKGGYELKALTSATVVTLTDANSVEIVDLRSLASVTSLSDGSGAGTFEFDKATELHLTALPRYTGSLALKVKKGGVIDMTAFRDVAADGTAAANTLTISGPASMTIANLTGDKAGSTLTLNNVASATVNGYDGAITLGTGVETFSSDNVVSISLGSASDLETVTIKGILDPNATTADTAGPAIAFTSTHANLISATLTGVLGAVSATSVANLEKLTVNADLNAAALSVTGNNDLTSLVVTGSKIGDVTLQNNTDLETVTFDHTSDLTTALTGTGVTVSITGNTNMTSLNWSADDVDNLTITGNSQLSKVNFTGLKDLGTSTAATALIKQNDIDASSAADAYQASGTLAAGTDAGTFTTASGIETLKTWLDAALAATGAKDIEVYFDEVSAVTKQTAAAGAYADQSHTDGYTSAKYNAIAYSKTTAATGQTVRQKRSWVMSAVENGLNAQNTAVSSTESTTITASGVQVNYGSSASINTVSALVAAMNGATDFGSDYTVAAAQDSYKKSIITVKYVTSDGATAATTVASGTLYFTYGTITGTIDLGVGSKTASITSLIAAQISGTSRATGTTSLNLYNAEQGSNTDEIIVYRTVSYTGYPSDLGPNAGTFPSLSFTIDAAQTSTTVQLSQASSNTAAQTSGTFYLTSSKSDLTGVRVTITNNSQTESRTAKFAEGVDNLSDLTQLVSGTNTIGNFSLIADFSDVSNQTPASTSTVDRTSWLGS